MEDVRYNLQPTQHDALAQGAGKYTFFIDESQKMWLGLGARELDEATITSTSPPDEAKLNTGFLTINRSVSIPLQTMRRHPLREGSHRCILLFLKEDEGKACEVKSGMYIS